MSTLGPLETSLLQAAQAQQVASRSRDRERNARDLASRRFRDLVELRVVTVEAAQAVRPVSANETEEAAEEHRADGGPDVQPPGRVDVQA